MRLHASLCPHAMLARWQGAGALIILRPQTLHLPQTLHVTSWWCPSGCLSCCARAAYLVVADEQYGRQIPFAFLDKVRAEFAEKYADSSRTLHAHSLDKTLGCA